MRQRFIWFVFVGLFFGLVGCSTESRPELTKTKAGYITDLTDSSILVNDIVFFVDQNIEVVSNEGKQIEFSDLEIGMKVEPWFAGPIRESYPAQADAKKIIVLKDKDGERMQEAVKAVVNFAATHYGKTVIFQETKLSKEDFLVTIAGMTIENPNPITLRYDFGTKQIQVE